MIRKEPGEDDSHDLATRMSFRDSSNGVDRSRLGCVLCQDQYV